MLVASRACFTCLSCVRRKMKDVQIAACPSERNINELRSIRIRCSGTVLRLLALGTMTNDNSDSYGKSQREYTNEKCVMRDSSCMKCVFLSQGILTSGSPGTVSFSILACKLRTECVMLRDRFSETFLGSVSCDRMKLNSVYVSTSMPLLQTSKLSTISSNRFSESTLTVAVHSRHQCGLRTTLIEYVPLMRARRSTANLMVCFTTRIPIISC